jgi:hypothetical protein
MRAVSSSMMAALVMVALFWGNCLSCPQVLLSLQKHKASHDCCKRGQKPVAKTCSSQGLQHFVKAEPAAAPAATAPAAEAVVIAAVPVPLSHASAVVLPAAGHAPPDLLSLHSSFRI